MSDREWVREGERETNGMSELKRERDEVSEWEEIEIDREGEIKRERQREMPSWIL